MRSPPPRPDADAGPSPNKWWYEMRTMNPTKTTILAMSALLALSLTGPTASADIRECLEPTAESQSEQATMIPEQCAVREAQEAVENADILAPSPVNAGFVGQSSCNGQTGLCTFAWDGIHYADLVSVGGVGIGSFRVSGVLTTSCTFVGPVPCTTPGIAAVDLDYAYCSSIELTAESISLLGGSASASKTAC